MNIGIVGKMCSGKTTLANKIKDNYPEYNITSFAKKVKEIAVDLFGMKEKDRKLLQDIGSKMREIDKDIWAKYTLKECEKYKNSIIDDVRYENEINYLKEQNWFLIKLEITPETQLARLKKTYPHTWSEHLNNINHSSENLINIPDSYYNLIINCEESIEDIYNKINKFLDRGECEMSCV